MPTYIGENEIVDRYLGDKFLEAAYIGDEKVYDPYTEITGYLPMIFKSRAAVALKNYRIYGKTVENLADAIIEHANINSDGRIANPGAIDPASDTFVLYIAPVISGKTYTITTSTYDSAVVYAFYSTQPAYGVVSYNNARTVLEGTHQATITAPITGWIAFRDYVTAPAGMIVEGSTPAPIYVPPGTTEGAGVDTENLFDKDAKDTANGYVLNEFLRSDGSSTHSTNYYISEYIPIQANETYTFTAEASANTPCICFYDAQKNVISGESYAERSSFTITSPVDTVYARLSVRNNYAGSIMFTKGSTAPASYIPYGYKIPILLDSGNIFDNSTDTSKGYVARHYLTSTGELVSSSSWFITPYIAVESNSVYTLTGLVGKAPSFVEYTEDKTYIKGTSYNQNTNLKFTTEATTRYIRISYNVSNIDIVAFISESNYDLFIGSTKLGAEEYVDFGEQKIYKMSEGTLVPADPPAPLPPIPTYKGENTLSSTETVGEVTVKGRISEISPTP